MSVFSYIRTEYGDLLFSRSVAFTALTRVSGFFNGKPPCNMIALNKPHRYFEYLSPKNELEGLHSAIQRVFPEEIADGKITVTLVKVKRVQIPAFHGMTDLQIRDKVRSIIKAKIIDENNTQDEEELLPGN